MTNEIARRFAAVTAVLLGFAAAAPDARGDLAPGLHTGLSLMHGGLLRTYDVLVPASYDGSADVPLVVDLHGNTGTSSDQRSGSGFVAIAEAQGFIVAWPQGRVGGLGTPGWNAGTICGAVAADDVGFIRAMVAAIDVDSRIDPARIYATGGSCGGAMTHRLACEAADLFAGAATFAFPGPLGILCTPSRPIPVLMVHGRQDETVPYDGNGLFPPAREGFEDWRMRNGCTGSAPDVTETPDATSVCEFYTNCSGGVEVGLCSVDAGHNSYSPLNADPFGLNTQQRVWEFFGGSIPDTDGDSFVDSQDKCPSMADSQADTDGDGVGDACDNCTMTANPRVPGNFLAANAWATLTGGQRDDDHDGFGNVCDGDFPGTSQGGNVGPADVAQFKASNGRDRSTDTCGTPAGSGTRPCSIFDLNLAQNTDGVANISPADVARFKTLNGSAAGPKCAACTATDSAELGCNPGTNGSCNVEPPCTFQSKWGSAGTGPGQFDHPGGVAIDGSGNVYVSDILNHRVQKFASDGTYLTQWGGLGSGAGQFNQATGIAVDGSGNVFVCDSGNARIQKFTSTGGFLTQWGSPGTGNGQFGYCLGVGIDGSGDVYVADWENNNIQKFTNDGTYLTQWGGFGSGNGQISNPDGLAVDVGGNVYVAEESNHRVQKFTSTGAYVTQWGGYGNAVGHFGYPVTIAVDASSNVYVTDRFNDRVQKFTSAGTFLSAWGGSGSGDGQFSTTVGVAVDGSGNVFVTDGAINGGPGDLVTNNNRVQKFTCP